MMLWVILIVIIAVLVTLLSYRFLRSLDCDLTLCFYERFCGSLKPLSDKVIWITGASSGIGEHLAYVLSESVNCKLVLSGTNTQRLEAVKEQCLSRSKRLTTMDILLVPFDITDIGVHQAAFESVLEHYNRLDILINNAGKSQRAEFHEIQLEVDRQLFDINVFGLINLSRIVLRYWYANNIAGQFLVTSSTAGKIGAPYSASYTASKFALHGYFESLRIESYHKKISITLSCPGPIVSKILQNALTAEVGQVVGRSHDISSQRMSTERCARLMCVGLVHKLDELWISKQPILTIYYLSQYMPSITRRLLPKFFDKKKFAKIRDGE